MNLQTSYDLKIARQNMAKIEAEIVPLQTVSAWVNDQDIRVARQLDKVFTVRCVSRYNDEPAINLESISKVVGRMNGRQCTFRKDFQQSKCTGRAGDFGGYSALIVKRWNNDRGTPYLIIDNHFPILFLYETSSKVLE